MLEQRNDSLKSSNEQSQARVLQAEQDKVNGKSLDTTMTVLCPGNGISNVKLS